MENLMTTFNDAVQKLYEHVGFKEDWVVCPIDDKTDMFWSTDGDTVKYAPDKAAFNGEGDYYEDDVYKQRFYKQWIYKGSRLTMIFCDPHVNGVKWFRVFDNSKLLP